MSDPAGSGIFIAKTGLAAETAEEFGSEARLALLA